MSANEQRSRCGQDGGEVSLYTCYISPCPESRNVDFKHPDFLICYRCPEETDDDISVVKYYCSPLVMQGGTSPAEVVVQATTSGNSDGPSHFFQPQQPQFFQHHPSPRGFFFPPFFPSTAYFG